MSARTEWGDYLFAVKEFGDGTPWITLELRREPGLSILRDGYLGLTFREGTTLDQAKEIASMLNRSVRSVSYTDMPQVRAG